MRYHRCLLNQVTRALLLNLGICIVGGISSSTLQAQDTSEVPNATTEVLKPRSKATGESDKELERCRIVGQEMARRLSLPAEQLHGLPDIHTTWQECAHYSGPIRNQFQPTRPIYTDPIPAVPLATPTLPPSLTGNPSAAEINSSTSQSNGIHSVIPGGPPVPVRLDPQPRPIRNQ
jgi:hypothetical protein